MPGLVNQRSTKYTAVSKVLQTANESGSQLRITLRVVIGYLIRMLLSRESRAIIGVARTSKAAVTVINFSIIQHVTDTLGA